MNIALILSGGTGTRMGMDIPKQYISVNGRMIVEYCMDVIFSSALIDKVCVVADAGWHSYMEVRIANMKKRHNVDKFMGFALPGETRQLSVVNGLEKIMEFAGKEDFVMIHDGARPLVTHDIIQRCFECVEGHEGVMPVLPMKDTIYMSEDGQSISGLIKREKVFAGQAPEVFALGKYYSACKALKPEKMLAIKGSSEPAVLYGMDIVMTRGDESNYKITTPDDLRRFEEYVRR